MKIVNIQNLPKNIENLVKEGRILRKESTRLFMEGIDATFRGEFNLCNEILQEQQRIGKRIREIEEEIGSIKIFLNFMSI